MGGLFWKQGFICLIVHRTVHHVSLSCSCWIQDNVVFYVSVVAYIFLVFLTNTAMFITVLLQIHSVKSRTQMRSRFWKRFFLQDLKSAFSLMFLLGLTWSFAFFAWGAVRIFFLYLFSIFNTLQGNFWMEYSYKCNSLGLWNRNTFVVSYNYSMGEVERSYGFWVTLFCYFIRKAQLKWNEKCCLDSIAMIGITVRYMKAHIWNVGPNKHIFSGAGTVFPVWA